jgi:hypothetical protein
MARLLADRVKETTTTTGTGTISLAGAVSNFQTFVAGIGDTNTCYYAIVHQTDTQWEVGIGTVTDASPDTLSRDTLIASSTGSAIDFTAGMKDVFVTIPSVFGNLAEVYDYTASEALPDVNFLQFNDGAIDTSISGSTRKAIWYLKSPGTMQAGRLTLTSATPVTTSNVTAATTVYYAPYKGDRCWAYDGTRWRLLPFTEKSIKTQDAQTGTTTNGNKIISGLTDTSQLVRGMKVTGTNVGVGAVISTIDSPTQVTVSVNSTGSASNTMTFKCPASTQYDIFAVVSSNTIALRFSNAWASTTSRTDALTTLNGAYVNNAAINSGDSNSIAANKGAYLGSISTTATDGQTEDSNNNRLIWNNYNRVLRFLQSNDATDSWTYSTATWQEQRAQSTIGTSRVAVMIGLSEDLVKAVSQSFVTTTGGVTYGASGVGIDSSTTNSALTFGQRHAAAAEVGLMPATYLGYPGIGYHTIRHLEIATTTATSTWYGDGGFNPNIASGMVVEVLA